MRKFINLCLNFLILIKCAITKARFWIIREHRYEKTIKKNYQFRWIIKKGKKVNKKTVRVFITNNKEKKNKMGIAIKKNIKSAILRNRVKRVIREVYRLEEKKLKQHYNIIICFNTDSVNYNDIYSDIKKAFYELDMYIDKG